eukprot:Polyplicarium_translucidae@DN2167_c0_g1_i1.p3
MYHMHSIVWNGHLSLEAALTALVGFPIGMLLVASQAAHRAMGLHMGSPPHGAALNFAIALPYYITAAFGTHGVPRYSDVKRGRDFIGGLFGGLAILALVIAPTHLGYYGTSAWFLCGLLASSLLFDTLGLMGTAPVPIHGMRIAGMCLLMAGVAGIQLDRKRSARGAGSGDPV